MATKQNYTDHELNTGGSGGGGNIYVQNQLDVVFDEVQYMGYKRDGKKVYRKVFDMGTLNGANVTKPHGLTGIKVFFTEGGIRHANNDTYGLTMATPGGSACTVLANATNIMLYTTSGLTNYTSTWAAMYFIYDVEPEDPPSPFTQALVPQMRELPDLDKIETVNLWASSSSWTCDKPGYIKAILRAVADTSSANAAVSLVINGVSVDSPSFSGTSAGFYLGGTTVYPVSLGDVVSYITNAPTPYQKELYFIPSKWEEAGVPVNLIPVDKLGGGSDVGFEDGWYYEKHISKDGDKIWKGKYLGLTYTGATIASYGGSGTYQVPVPTNPPGVTRTWTWFGVVSTHSPAFVCAAYPPQNEENKSTLPIAVNNTTAGYAAVTLYYNIEAIGTWE